MLCVFARMCSVYEHNMLKASSGERTSNEVLKHFIWIFCVNLKIEFVGPEPIIASFQPSVIFFKQPSFLIEVTLKSKPEYSKIEVENYIRKKMSLFKTAL